MCVCVYACVCVCVCVWEGGWVVACVRALILPSGVQCCADPSDPESKVRGDLSSPSDFITVVTSPPLDLS